MGNNQKLQPNDRNRKERRIRESLERRGFQVVEFPPGEDIVLFVAAKDIGRVVIGLTTSTAANWRSLGIGPEYHLIGGRAYYEYAVLKEFFGRNKVITTGDLERQKQEEVA